MSASYPEPSSWIVKVDASPWDAYLGIFFNSSQDNTQPLVAIEYGKEDTRFEKGAIHVGTVVRVLTQQKSKPASIFVDIGDLKTALLQLRSNTHARHSKLREGDAVTVQVVRPAIIEQNKGAKVSLRLETAAPAILANLAPLTQAKAPYCLQPAPSILQRWRQQCSKASSGSEAELSRIVIDAPTEYLERWRHQAQTLKETASDRMSETRIDTWSSEHSIWQLANYPAPYAQTPMPKVGLANGGQLNIDEVEAATLIDVNLGKAMGRKKSSQTIEETNQQAAAEIIRQIGTRNLGGMVLIDFIRGPKTQQQSLLTQFKEKAGSLHRKVIVHGFSRMGLAELSVQSHGPSLQQRYKGPPDRIFQAGRLWRILRDAQRRKRQSPAFQVHPEVAQFMPELIKDISSLRIEDNPKTDRHGFCETQS